MKNISLALLVLTAVFSCKKKEKKSEALTEAETEVIETIEDQMEEEHWLILFDGTNLDAWRGYNSDKMYSNWTIEDDGSLLFTPDKEGGKNIITEVTFTDFVLSLEWKVSKGANSGIFWSVHEDEKFGEAYQTGPEIQILDNERHPDAKAGETHKAGSLYDLIACPDSLVNPAGEWNKCVLEINHKTNVGKVTMNGIEAFTFPLSGEKWDTMIKNSKFNGWEGFGMHHTGHIGLQDHGDKVWFRDIKVKVLE